MGVPSITPAPKHDSIPIATRIVHTFRRDIPLASLDLVACIGAYLVPLILRFDGKVPSMGRPVRGRNGAIKRLRPTALGKPRRRPPRRA